MNDATVNINLNIDPATITPGQVAEYAATVVAKLTETLATTAGIPASPAAHIVGIDKQLGRLTDHNVMFAPRVKRLHNELTSLGYVPTLPNSTKDPLPSYLSYIDPATGQNFGNVNSERFYVMRGALRDELADLPHFSADARYANCHLTSDEAVDALLAVAAAKKA